MAANQGGLRILALGEANAKAAAQSLFGEDAKIDNMRKVPDRGLYDSVISYHHLQTVAHDDLDDTLEKIRFRIKEGGDFHVFIPSLEWAGHQILNRKNALHPLLRKHLFNDGKNKNAFRMFDLRNALENHFAVTHATAGEYTDTAKDGNKYAAGQLYARGEPK